MHSSPRPPAATEVSAVSEASAVTEVKWQRARHRSSVTCTNTYCGHLREIYSRVEEDPVGGPQDPTHQLVCTQPAMAHEDLSLPSGSACELAPHMLRLPMIFELRRLTQKLYLRFKELKK